MARLGIKKFTPIFDRTRKCYISHERQWRTVPLYRRGECRWHFSIEDWIQNTVKGKIRFLYFIVRLRRKIAGQLELFPVLAEKSMYV